MELLHTQLGLHSVRCTAHQTLVNGSVEEGEVAIGILERFGSTRSAKDERISTCAHCTVPHFIPHNDRPATHFDRYFGLSGITFWVAG